MVDADVVSADANTRNAVYAQRTNGAQQYIVRNQDSIDRYGLHSYKRTDLGLETGPQVGDWATFLITLQSVPRPQLGSLTIRPVFDPTIWPALLGLRLVTDRVRVLWTPPDMTTTTEVFGRTIAISHTVTRDSWSVGLELALADIFASVMHWGIHPLDKLDRGNLYV
jgi:hypothetical protein